MIIYSINYAYLFVKYLIILSIILNANGTIIIITQFNSIHKFSEGTANVSTANNVIVNTQLNNGFIKLANAVRASSYPFNGNYIFDNA
jgi:hypothetical protein